MRDITDAVSRHQDNGLFQLALDLTDQALAGAPGTAAHHVHRGEALRALGRLDGAVAAFHRAIALQPKMATAWSGLGMALIGLRRLESGVAACHHALALAPALPAAHLGLAVGRFHQKDVAESEVACGRALRLRPAFPEALNLLAALRVFQGRLEDAHVLFGRALQAKPVLAEAYANRAQLHAIQGRLGSALKDAKQAITLNPELAAAHALAARLHRMLRACTEAATSARRAAILQAEHLPVFLETVEAMVQHQELPAAEVACRDMLLGHFPGQHALWNTYGIVLGALGKREAALGAYRNSLALKPDLEAAHCNMGTACFELGDADGAAACVRRAIDIRPDLPMLRRNLIGIIPYITIDEEARFAEHRRFEEAHARQFPAPLRPHATPPDPHRRLRIGYLSSDFRHHPVARNMIPILEAHDRTGFEVFCYADLRSGDAMTRRFQNAADGWRLVAGLSDDAVAAAIRADGIDILICLAGHFDANRLLACACKPAPIQASWHDSGTSGLSAMDYLITDPVASPRHGKERFTERLIRLPSTFFVYEPPDAAPPVTPPPCLDSGLVSFACLNNPIKLNSRVVALWATVLNGLPGSRLVLKYRDRYAVPYLRDRIFGLFATHGVEAERIVTPAGANEPSRFHLERYRDADIALDPFPFSGATTTFEALWMGVPVVTLPGDNMMSRYSASLLHAIGLDGLVARSAEEYAAIAWMLAADRGRLAELRASLRRRLASSPVFDARMKTRHIERAYRFMWRRWCATRGPSAPVTAD